jgi:hypothetical protein
MRPDTLCTTIHLNSADYNARNDILFQFPARADLNKWQKATYYIYVRYFSMKSPTAISGGIYLRSADLTRNNIGSSLQQSTVLAFIPSQISEDAFLDRFEFIAHAKIPNVLGYGIPPQFDLRLTDRNGNLLNNADLGDWSLGLTIELFNEEEVDKKK